MLSVAQALAMAWEYYQAGQLQQAEQLFRQILQADPNQVDALHLLGLIALQTGRDTLALYYLQAAVHLRPDFAEAHNNLGMALQTQGKFAEAVLSHEQAVRLRPDFAEAHNNLGRALQLLGNLAGAVASFQEAVRLRPDYAELHYNLGSVLQQQGKLADAAVCLQEVRRLRPDSPEAHFNLGIVLHRLGKLPDAVACFEQALRLRSDFAEAHNNLASSLQLQGQLDEAVASYGRALRLKPDSAEAHFNLGSALQAQGKFAEAAASYQEALRLRPNYAEARNNLGNTYREQGLTKKAVANLEWALRLRPKSVEAYINLGVALQEQGELAEAAVRFEQALRLQPDCAEAHYDLGMLRLLEGDFEHGWPEHEWRLQLQARRVSETAGSLAHASALQPGPGWDGGPLAGKTFLICAEQGLGDTIQFIRYAAVLKERGATVVAEVQPDLLGVLAGCPGIDQLVGQGSPPPQCDVQAPLVSLPALCGTTLATIPAQVPYLLADRSRVAHWRERLAGVSGVKVGICWQGNPAYKHDRRRSVSLERFAPLAEIPGIRLVCLQKGPGREQWDALAARWPTVDLPGQAEEPSQGWVDTAGLVCAVDLVITVDTAVAHLAGALGVSVWVALPFAPDWRWLLGREDSPWYPSMRLFRQTQAGDWPEVFQRIKDALQEQLAS
jgi:tetratricopeptide (TPR) repeat protein